VQENDRRERLSVQEQEKRGGPNELLEGTILFSGGYCSFIIPTLHIRRLMFRVPLFYPPRMQLVPQFPSKTCPILRSFNIGINNEI